MDDYTQNEAEQKQSTKCSRELWIQNTAQNLLDCPEIRYFRSFSEDNLLTLHNIQGHWEDNVTEFRNLDIKSRFDLNCNIGCLGIWAPGIYCPAEHDTEALSAAGPRPWPSIQGPATQSHTPASWWTF